MSELEEKISSVLSDPQQMSQLMNMAQSLMGGTPPKAETQQPMLQKLMSGFGKSSFENKSNTAMLRAICPYLDEKRGRKLEKAIRMSEIAKIARNYLKEQGGANE